MEKLKHPQPRAKMSTNNETFFPISPGVLSKMSSASTADIKPYQG